MNMQARTPRSVLFVHAHPDDETLATGVALAHLRDRGHAVHVLTCTLGDEGEVIPPDLAHLEGAEGLAAHRRAELVNAMRVLGVEHRVIGEDPGHPDAARALYRDSGMAGSPASQHPRALTGVPVADVAAHVLAEIRRTGADVVVTYDEHGGYGHPDHIQVHRATVAAVRMLPFEERPELYAVVTPRSWAQEDRAWLAEHVPAGLRAGEGKVPRDGAVVVPGPADPFPVSVVEDDLVTHEVGDDAARRRQAEALRAHETQVRVDPGGHWYTLSNDVAARLPGREGYARLDPQSGRLVAGDAGVRAPLLADLPSAEEYRRAMARFATGVTVVTTEAGGQVHAMTANSVTSVSLDPVLMLVSVEKEARFHDAVTESGRWAVSVLAADQRAAAQWLSTRGRPLMGQLDRVRHHAGPVTGLPLVSGALAYFECAVVQQHPAGDHTILVGRVLSAEAPEASAPALTYHRGQFKELA